MSTLLRIGVFLIVSLSVSACAEKPPPVAGPEAALDPTRIRSTCPLGVENAHVAFDETATGATLVFTTTPDRLEELRLRVREAGELHGRGKHAGEGHEGKHGTGNGQHGLQPETLPPTHVEMTSIEGGARLTFTPERMDDVEALRDVLRYRADRMMAHCG